MISRLVLECDVVGLCETWLRPGELPVITSSLLNMPEIKSQQHNCIRVFAKSGMNDASPGYRGRPYGGVALICKQHSTLSFSELETNNDRIVAVKGV